MPPDMISAIEEKLRPILEQPGAVLFSGWDTLVKGDFYMMGFNPGGDPEWVAGDGPNDEQTIGASLKRDKPCYNDWTDAHYGPGGTFSPLQTRIKSVLDALNAVPGKTFSTNALFTRARVTHAVKEPWQLWWDYCWPVHQLFLATVQPKVILCLGAGPTSAWEFLRITKPLSPGKREYQPTWQNDQDETAVGGKWRPKVTFDLDGDQKHTCAVLGLLHPSGRNAVGWPLSSDARDKIKLACETASRPRS